jgi:endo-1,4-beta-xylanase
MLRHRFISRRQILGLMAGAACAIPGVRRALAEPATLREAARRSGLFFGAAVRSHQLNREADFASAMARECSVIVPEWEMKWAAVEPSRGRRNFAPSDTLLRFAASHNLKCRGHTLIWHRSIPAWAKEALADRPDWSLVESHIAAVMGRYKREAFIHWDVLNEVIEPKDGRDDALRASPFLAAFGPDYISRALAAAHERAPGIPLYINEYGLDYDGKIERDRRLALLRLIERLKKADAPLHGVGIQAHLRIDNSKFSEQSLRRFLADLAGHGLKITLTELDVRERDLQLPVEERDSRVAREAARYLAVALDEPAVVGIVTWGLSDRHHWRNDKLRPGAIKNRGLPLDDNLAPKPLKHAMLEALKKRAER